MKSRFIVSILVVVCILSLLNVSYSGEGLFLPKVERNLSNIILYFVSPKEAENYVTSNRSEYDYFKVGMYFYYTGLSMFARLTNRGDFFKGIDERRYYFSKAVEYFQKCLQIQTNNPYFISYLGLAKSLFGIHSGIIKAFQENNEAISLLNRAVEIDKNNPEIRSIRFLLFVNYPYRFFSNLRKVIEEDFDISIRWLYSLEEYSKNDNIFKKFYDKENIWELKNQHLFSMGRYYYDGVGDKKKAQIYFDKIPKDSFWYTFLQNYLKGSVEFN